MARVSWIRLLCVAWLACSSVGQCDGARIRFLRARRPVADRCLQPDAVPVASTAHSDQALLHLRSAQRSGSAAEAEAEAKAKAKASAEAETSGGVQSGASQSAAPALYQSHWLWQGPGLESLRQAHAHENMWAALAAADGSVRLGDFEYLFDAPALAALGPLLVGDAQLQRVRVVRGWVPPRLPSHAHVDLATNPQFADLFADAVYFADFRMTRDTAAAGAVGMSAGLLIPPSLGLNPDFNRHAINFFVQSDRNYVYVAQVERARALQDALAANPARRNCRVWVEIQLAYPPLPAQYRQPRYIPTGGTFRIVAPTPTCGGRLEIHTWLTAYQQQAGGVNAPPALVHVCTMARAWLVAAVDQPNELAAVTAWKNPEDALPGAIAYVTNRAAPGAWAGLWLMQSGPTLSEARARQGIAAVGNQLWVPVVPPVLAVTVGGVGHLGTADQGSFTYTLDPNFHRVTQVTGEAWPSDVDSVTNLGGTAICDTMYFADFRHDRMPANGALPPVGQSAGHIVAPSIAGPVTHNVAIPGASIFNEHPINFFPQSVASNGGVYNHMEAGIQGFLSTVAGMGANFAACRPTVTITFTYGAHPTSSRYIPTGGTYAAALPMAACGNVASPDDLFVLIRAHPAAAHLARRRKVAALKWLHPLRAPHDTQDEKEKQCRTDDIAAQNALALQDAAWNQFAGNSKGKALAQKKLDPRWHSLLLARQGATIRRQMLQTATAALAPLVLALQGEAQREALNQFSDGPEARVRPDIHNHGWLLKTVAWTNP